MVKSGTESSGPQLDIRSALRLILQSKNVANDKLIIAFDSLLGKLSAKDRCAGVVSAAFQHFSTLLMSLGSHIHAEDPVLAAKAANFLGLLLYFPESQAKIKHEEALKILDDIILVLNATSDKVLATRCVWCLSQPKLPDEVFLQKIPDCLKAIENVVKRPEICSPPVINEIAKVYSSFLTKYPTEAIGQMGLWLPVAFKLAVEPSAKVREKLIALFEEIHATLSSKQIHVGFDSVSKEDWKEVVGKMPELVRNKQEVQILRIWMLMLKLGGPNLNDKSASSILNQLLKVVELCFKSSSDASKSYAFKAWKVLVENFALDSKIVRSPSRMRLILQPLLQAPALSEAVCVEKLGTWWKFCFAVGDILEENFESLCVPLLRVCVGGKLDKEASLDKLRAPLSPKTPLLHLSLGQNENKTNFGPAELPVFPALQKTLGPRLRKMLHGPDAPDTDAEIYNFRKACITQPVTFLPNAQFLMQCLRSWIAVDCSDYDTLVVCWRGFVTLMYQCNEAEHFPTLVEQLLVQFDAMLRETSLPSHVVLDLFEATVLKEEVSRMQFAPGALLLRGFLHSDFPEEEEERVTQVVQKLVSSILHVSPLRLLEVADKVLRESVLPRIASLPSSARLRLWERFAAGLRNHFEETSEVNQGTALAPDYFVAQTLLAFPVLHLSPATTYAEFKCLPAAWKSLFEEVDRCILLDPTSSRQSSAQEAAQAFSGCQSFEAPFSIAMASEAARCIVDRLDYKREDEVPAGRSPSKGKEKMLEPLGPIHGLIELIAKVLEGFNHCEKNEENAQLLSHCVGNCIAAVNKVFDLLSGPGQQAALVALLGKPFAEFLQISNSEAAANLFKGHMTKLDQCFATVLGAVEQHYSGPLDSDFLAEMDPLIVAGLSSSRKGMRDTVGSFWSATFASSTNLTYSTTLRERLQETKGRLIAPGLSEDMDLRLDDDPHQTGTPSDLTMPAMDEVVSGAFSLKKLQEESPPTLPPSSSTFEQNRKIAESRKIFGSLIKDTDENGAPSSGNESAASSSASKGRKKNGKRRKKSSPPPLEELPEEEFVPISSPARKKMNLTKHQKEVFREQHEGAAPAESSVSMSDFFNTDSQEPPSVVKPTASPKARKSIPSKSRKEGKRAEEEPITAAELPETNAENKGKKRRSIKLKRPDEAKPRHSLPLSKCLNPKKFSPKKLRTRRPKEAVKKDKKLSDAEEEEESGRKVENESFLEASLASNAVPQESPEVPVEDGEVIAENLREPSPIPEGSSLLGDVISMTIGNDEQNLDQTFEGETLEEMQENLTRTPSGGILKKQTLENSPLPLISLSTGKRHVRFSVDDRRGTVSDDEMSSPRKIRRLADEEQPKSKEAEELPSSLSEKRSISSDFVRRFQPRTLKMITGANGKKVESEENSCKGNGEETERLSSGKPDAVNPICPRLVGSEVKLGKVLNALTNSSFARGLENVLKAKKIVNVGGLARLTEMEVNALPMLKQPKVDTLKAVLATIDPPKTAVEVEAEEEDTLGELEAMEHMLKQEGFISDTDSPVQKEDTASVPPPLNEEDPRLSDVESTSHELEIAEKDSPEEEAYLDASSPIRTAESPVVDLFVGQSLEEVAECVGLVSEASVLLRLQHRLFKLQELVNERITALIAS